MALQLHHMQETRINLATAGLTKEEAKLIRKMWNDIITRGTWKVSRTLDFGDKLWVQAKQLCNERTQVTIRSINLRICVFFNKCNK